MASNKMMTVRRISLASACMDGKCACSATACSSWSLLQAGLLMEALSIAACRLLGSHGGDPERSPRGKQGMQKGAQCCMGRGSALQMYTSYTGVPVGFRGQAAQAAKACNVQRQQMHWAPSCTSSQRSWPVGLLGLQNPSCKLAFLH